MMGKAEFAANAYNAVLEGNALRLKEDQIEEAGQVFIQAAAMKVAVLPADKQARQFGACGLRNLATNEDNRYAMWQDKKVRKALLNSATLPTIFPADREAIKCALQAYAYLALEPANRRSIWMCRSVRRILIERAQQPETCYETRADALDALRNLALDKKVAWWMWVDRNGARRAILNGAALSASVDQYQVTRNALYALANLARVWILRPKIWNDYKAYSDILQAVSWDDAIDNTTTLTDLKNQVRAAGLTVTGWLVLHPHVAPAMFQDPIMIWIIQSALPVNGQAMTLYGHQVLRYAAKVGASKNLVKRSLDAANKFALTQSLNCTLYTQKALETLNGLALNCKVSADMWQDPFKSIFLDWSYSDGCDLCRQWAIDSVKNIATNPTMRMDVWLNQGGAMCVNMTSDVNCPSVRFLGFNCLWEIAGGNATKELVFNDPDAQAAILAATQIYGHPMPSMIRSVAFGVLWRLTTCPFIANYTWTDVLIRKNVVEAAYRLTQPGSILTRTFALGIMYQWSMPMLQLGPAMWTNNRIKQTVFSVALETTIWMNNAQLQALGILHNWALQYHGMKISMWEDREGAREVLLRISGNDTPQEKEARALAMCALQELAHAPMNQEAMWGSDRVRQTFTDGALDPFNRLAQECAITGFAWLATVPENAVAMWNDTQTQETILYLAGHCDPFRSQAQRLAVAVLQILAETPDNREPMWFSRASCLMIKLADPSLFSLISPIQHEIRAMALAVLWTLALNEKVRHRMFWDKFGTMRVLNIAAASPNPLQLRARIFALATYSRLAMSDDLRVLIWYTSLAKFIIVSAAGPQNLFPKSRAAAMSVLWQLSFNPHLKRPMWRCPITRRAIITGSANVPVPNEKVQLYALYTARNLAEAKCNMIPMWENAGMRMALIHTLAPPDTFVEAFGLAAMQILAYSRWNQRRMWRTPPPFTASVIAAANRDCLPDNSDITTKCWHSRQYALAMILLWSESRCNRDSMWANPLIQNMLHDVCVAPWTDDGPGTISRTYILETLQFLATQETAALALWNDAGVPSEILNECIVPNSILPTDPPHAQWTRCQMGDDSTQTLVPRLFIELEQLTNAQERLVIAGGTLAALGTLAEMAAYMDLQTPPNMWDEYVSNPLPFPTAAGNLIDACSRTDPRFAAFREVGCEGVANMAESSADQVAMWNDLTVRGGLVDAAQEHPEYKMDPVIETMWQPNGILQGVREQGMRGLANLAENVGNQQAMWLDAMGARGGLLLGTLIDPSTWQEGRTRSDGCRGFSNLAMLDTNREPMWANEEVREAIMGAAKDPNCKNKRARMYCMNALNSMSEATRNQATMWAGAEAVNTARRRRTGRRLGQRDRESRALSDRAGPAEGRLLAPPRAEDGGEAWARLAGFA